MASRSLAVRMPQNSKPYWWAAVWASIDTSDAGHGHRVEALRARRRSACDRAGDVGQRLGDVVEQADADLLEPAVALVGGEVHHPEHRAVLLPELEEGVDELERRGEGVGARPRPVGDDLGEVLALLGHLLGQHEDRRLDVGEVLVEGRRRRAGLAGDVDHLHVAVAGGGEHVAGALEQPLAGGAPAPTRDAAVGGPEVGVVGGVTHRSRPLGRPLPELGLEHLVAGVHRERLDDADLARDLEVGHGVARPRDQRVGIGRASRRPARRRPCPPRPCARRARRSPRPGRSSGWRSSSRSISAG